MEKYLELEEDKEKFYRFQCDCLTPSDAMDVQVDGVGGAKHDDGKFITISMYFDGTGFWSRVKYAWQILRGHWSWREFIVRTEDAKPLSDLFNPEVPFSKLP